MNSRTFRLGLVLAVVMVAFGVCMFRPSVANQTSAPAASPCYTVVDSDGTNLEVVDNTTNTLYFYTVDPGKNVGDDLHLRGSIDLKEVGKSVLSPKTAK